MNTLFWGSSQLSIPFLSTLLNNKFIKLSAVVTLSDKPQGRGMKILPTPVKRLAQEHGIKTIMSDVIASETFYKNIAELEPELSVVVSYGKIIPNKIIKLHKIGMINIHFSLLPKYRGAAPIQWALINGESKTGVTIFWIDEGLDTGDIFVQKETKITIDDNYFTLSERLIKLGTNALEDVVRQILDGKIIRISQKGEASYAPLINKQIAKIDWNKPAISIHNLVRALVQWPKAYSILSVKNKGSIKVKILQTQIDTETVGNLGTNLVPGTVVKISNHYISVLCGESSFIKILKLQPENKNVLDAQQFICGYKVQQYDKFS
ncbi:MAG: methionyl-tRNA formyltransferase [Endomicrobia bacterium]|nr:methionyl-tRNA formyltransferase [Endomicrobiia bacterium]